SPEGENVEIGIGKTAPVASISNLMYIGSPKPGIYVQGGFCFFGCTNISFDLFRFSFSHTGGLGTPSGGYGINIVSARLMKGPWVEYNKRADVRCTSGGIGGC